MIPATTLRMIVVVSGTNHSRPNIRNRKSPGNLPKPMRWSHGARPLKSSSARMTTTSQRIIARSLSAGSERVGAVALTKTHRIPELAAMERDHLEELAHFMLGDQ